MRHLVDMYVNRRIRTETVVAGFGIDADTKANYAKKGSPTGSVVNDDWFSPVAATGRNVPDTSNISTYKASLMANQNITFTKGMSVPLLFQSRWAPMD